MTNPPVYINPLTDFGFKLLFGQECNKVILISFLNSIFSPQIEISDVKFIDKERLGESKEDRTMIYDLHCETTSGETIIVEMQNRYQSNFKDRTIYYHSKGFAEQGKKGIDWEYSLMPVYSIYITNFSTPLFEDEQMLEEVCLINVRTHKIFSDKLRMIFLKVPQMDKTPEECTTLLQKWMYIFKNLEHMKNIPEIFEKEPVFRTLDKAARYGTLNENERYRYDHSLKVYRDNLAILKTERAEGFAEGIEKGMADEKLLMIQSMVKEGLSTETIAKIARIQPEEVKKILNHSLN